MAQVVLLIVLWCLFHNGNKILLLIKYELLLFDFVKDHETLQIYQKILVLFLTGNSFFLVNVQTLQRELTKKFFVWYFFLLPCHQLVSEKNQIFIVFLWLKWLYYETMLLTLEFLLIDSFPSLLGVSFTQVF